VLIIFRSRAPDASGRGRKGERTGQASASNVNDDDMREKGGRKGEGNVVDSGDENGYSHSMDSEAELPKVARRQGRRGRSNDEVVKEGVVEDGQPKEKPGQGRGKLSDIQWRYAYSSRFREHHSG